MKGIPRGSKIIELRASIVVVTSSRSSPQIFNQVSVLHSPIAVGVSDGKLPEFYAVECL